MSLALSLPLGCGADSTSADAHVRREASAEDAALSDVKNDIAALGDARAGDASLPTIPGGKQFFSVVYGNLDGSDTTWVRHANYTFKSDATVASTYWHWESSLNKGKTAHTSHRCTFDGVTKECAVYVPTGWVDPAKEYINRSGTFSLADDGQSVDIRWQDTHTEAWTIKPTSTSGLVALSFKEANFGVTHGEGFGSNADWKTFRTLPEIVDAGGLKTWPGQTVGASSPDGTTINTSAWRSTRLNLQSFTSASLSSEGFTLHAMLPHSPNVCTGGCSGGRRGNIMYHLASKNLNRQMAYNNWCTCLSIGDEWPCYNRNMHPWAFMSIIEDGGAHRGWLFIEQQNQPGYDGYQYQLGYFTDL